MKRVSLHAGHGRRDDRTFDPGAVAPDGTREYDMNRHLVVLVDAGLERCGVRVDADIDGHGPTEDPNYKGSVRLVNAGNYDVAVSLHNDWHKAPRGLFPITTSHAGRHVGEQIAAAAKDHGLVQRAPDYNRDNLYFLNQTVPPAVLVECDRVGADATDPDHLGATAEAIVDGLCRALGVAYRAPVQVAEWDVAVIYDPSSDGRDEGAARTLADAQAWRVLPVGHADRVGHGIGVGKAAHTADAGRYDSFERLAGDMFYDVNASDSTTDLVAERIRGPRTP